MEFDGNNELDDESYNSYVSDDTSESDFDFDYDKLINILDEVKLSDEDLDVNAENLNSMNESCITHSGFTSISLEELTQVPVFWNFSDEEILKLITDQTNI